MVSVSSLRSLTLALLVCAVCFAGLAGGQFMRSDSPLEARPVQILPTKAGAASEFPDDEDSPAVLVEALKRPLFSEDRRPFQPLAPKQSGRNSRPAGPAAIRPVLPRPDMRLLGVHLASSGKFALLSTPGLPRGEWFRLGAELEGWKLNRIDVDHVVFIRAPDSFSLKLHVDKSPAQIGSGTQLP